MLHVGVVERAAAGLHGGDQLIGLAADPGTLWEDLRVGELKTLLALACGDADALDEGLDWTAHFDEINADRRDIYRCLDALRRLEDLGNDCRDALESLFGPETVATAAALLDGTQRFFATATPGEDLKGCALHQRLLEAYGKAQVQRID